MEPQTCYSDRLILHNLSTLIDARRRRTDLWAKRSEDKLLGDPAWPGDIYNFHSIMDFSHTRDPERIESIRANTIKYAVLVTDPELREKIEALLKQLGIRGP